MNQTFHPAELGSDVDNSSTVAADLRSLACQVVALGRGETPPPPGDNLDSKNSKNCKIFLKRSKRGRILIYIKTSVCLY